MRHLLIAALMVMLSLPVLAHPRWQIEAPWWRIDDLNAVLEFKDVSNDPSYRDYVAYIDVGAAKAPLHHFPDGGGRHPKTSVRRYPAPD